MSVSFDDARSEDLGEENRIELRNKTAATFGQWQGLGATRQDGGLRTPVYDDPSSHFLAAMEDSPIYTQIPYGAGSLPDSPASLLPTPAVDDAYPSYQRSSLEEEAMLLDAASIEPNVSSRVTETTPSDVNSMEPFSTEMLVDYAKTQYSTGDQTSEDLGPMHEANRSAVLNNPHLTGGVYAGTHGLEVGEIDITSDDSVSSTPGDVEACLKDPNRETAKEEKDEEGEGEGEEGEEDAVGEQEEVFGMPPIGLGTPDEELRGAYAKCDVCKGDFADMRYVVKDVVLQSYSRMLIISQKP